jgi:hypothetical protein
MMLAQIFVHIGAGKRLGELGPQESRDVSGQVFT